ncbi:MAG: AAA family ATPase [Chloroflexi bacterium]|uniref:AAA family ATPase n=1 Tax=Candidatus Chlorohelix allophototropha TaxID=3003348 RepID=A0A8T7M3T9_9CHLR|nr:AAA family ATPase [Chloroflexota bacterium]WJW66112.1 AAA family ATPase [Chloroflexota bacterium L227-S17]
MMSIFGQKHNLPASLTSFVGRRKELEQIRQLMNTARLLTLIGPGGSGKTRLSIETATSLLENYRDGVWFIELSAISDPTLIPQTIVRALDLLEQQDTPLLEALAVYWRDKKILLILDNCEHLVEECARITSQLLKNCPYLQILATSREALSIAGENTLLIQPLSLPTAETGLNGSEALQLFTERVRAVHPNFVINANNAQPVSQICRKLEGIPLALELAAARTRSLSVEQIAERLDHRFHLLTNYDRTAEPRQQTLYALIEWSYSLLPEREKVVFLRLSIFTGGWTLEAAESVCAGRFQAKTGQKQIDQAEVLNLMSQLINKSLVQMEQTPNVRYRMLETIRQYALEKLSESGDLEVTRQRHAAYYLELAEQARTRLTGSEQIYWLERLETEHDNLRAVLGWATAPVPEQTNDSISPDFSEPYLVGLRLGGALWRFWQLHIHTIEGSRWLEKTVALAEGKPVPIQLKARAYHGLAILLSTLDFERSLYYHQENLRLRQEMNDLAGIADAYNGLGWVYFNYQHDLAKSHHLSRESEALARQLNDKWRIAAALTLRCLLAIADQDPVSSIPLAYEGNRLFQETGDFYSATTGFIGLSSMMLVAGDYKAARKLFKENLPLILQYKNKIAMLVALVHIAGLAGLEANETGPESARLGARLMSASMELGKNWTLGDEPPFSKRIREPLLQAIRSQLDEATYEAMVTEGKRLAMEEALALAQQIVNSEPELKPYPADTSPSGSTSPAGLSEREVEVRGGAFTLYIRQNRCHLSHCCHPFRGGK